MMPAMTRLTLPDLREPGATLGAGVSAGFLAGVLIGGSRRTARDARAATHVGPVLEWRLDGRRLHDRTREPSDALLAGGHRGPGDGWAVSSTWLFAAGSPSPWRSQLMTLFFALVGGAGLIGSERCRLHAPFAAPARGGAVRRDPRGLRRDDAVDRRTAAPRGLDPAKGALGLDRGLGAAAVREHRGRAGPVGCARGVGHRPLDTRARRCLAIQVVTWLGRAGLVAVALASGSGLVRDGIDILG